MPSNLTIISDFDFLAIQSQHRDELIEDTEKLQQLDTSELLIRIAKGSLLAKWRDLLDNGLWMAWTNSQFRYSHQTALNYIALYENFGDVENHILQNISGHYLLSSASDERRELVIDLASKGIKISKTLAYVFANAPAYILDLYQNEKLSPEQAKELIEAYKKIPSYFFEEAESLCYQWKPQTAAGIELIIWMIGNHRKRKSQAMSKNTLLEEITKTDGVLQAADFSVHISTADAATIEAFQSERKRMLSSQAINKAWVTYRTPAKFNQLSKGKLIVQIPNGLELDITNGSQIEIEIRVRKTNEQTNCKKNQNHDDRS